MDHRIYAALTYISNLLPRIMDMICSLYDLFVRVFEDEFSPLLFDRIGCGISKILA